MTQHTKEVTPKLHGWHKSDIIVDITELIQDLRNSTLLVLKTIEVWAACEDDSGDEAVITETLRMALAALSTLTLRATSAVLQYEQRDVLKKFIEISNE